LSGLFSISILRWLPEGVPPPTGVFSPYERRSHRLRPLLDFLPKYEFDKCVARYHGNFRVRKLSTYEQFLVLAFAQLT
jgi:hypothetical protein